MPSFSEHINGNKPVLVDFFAEWCGPCKAMAPILGKVAARVQNNATVLKVDVDKNGAVASSYGIQGVPTLILFKAGKIVWRQSGVVAEEQLVSIINQYK